MAGKAFVGSTDGKETSLALLGVRRPLATFGGPLVSRVGPGCPNPWRELAGSRGGRRWNYAPRGRRTSVQPSGQGTAVENVQARVVRKRTSGARSIALKCAFDRAGPGRRSQRPDGEATLPVPVIAPSGAGKVPLRRILRDRPPWMLWIVAKRADRENGARFLLLEHRHCRAPDAP